MKVNSVEELTIIEQSLIGKKDLSAYKKIKDKALFNLHKDLINGEISSEYARGYKEGILYFILLIKKHYE